MRLKLFVCCGVLNFLLAGVSSSLALGWEDEDWKKNGCPENYQGLWISRSSEVQPQRVYEVGPEAIQYMSGETGAGTLHYQRLQGEGGHDLLELKLKDLPVEIFRFPFLKIRPHQVYPQEKNDGFPGCYIKVFHFESRKSLQSQKYEAWNIFKLKPASKKNIKPEF